jgi:outer membrane protein assembly factor BamB
MKGVFRRLLPLVAGSMLLSACGLFSSNTRVIPPLKDAATLRAIAPRWHIDLGEGARLPLAPAVGDGRVYAARPGGEVLAIDAGTGQTLWKINLKAGLSGGVGAGEGSVVVGTVEGALIALDSAGQQRWQVSTGGGEISAAPLVADGVVVARTGDGKLVGLGLETGKVKWVVERNLPSLTLYRATSALATRGALFAGLPGGKLMAVAIDQGKVGWESAIALPRGATELERVADVTGAPVAGERDICAATYQGRVACLDAASGNALWSREASSVSGLGADAGRVFVADEKGVVNAWERGSGAPAWKNEDFTGRRLIGALAARGMVVTGDLQGYVHWLERDDGKTVARGATDGSSLTQQPLFLGDAVLVQTRKGGLYAFPMP